MCFKNIKCDICKKKSSNILIITQWTKWFGLKICSSCYEKVYKSKK